jgi:DNA-binding transcriptional regulator YiaG
MSPPNDPMTPDELRNIRRMCELPFEVFARRLALSTVELAAMEAGEIPIPERLEREAYIVADDAIREQDGITG